MPWSRVLSWRLHVRWWFYPAQLGSAILYSLPWYLGVLILASTGQAFVTHHFHICYFNSSALQWQSFSGLMIYCNIAGVLYMSQVNERLRQEERRREKAESLRTTAELSALRAQLNPHFLFNILNSIMALAGPGQPRTMRAIAQLAATDGRSGLALVNGTAPDLVLLDIHLPEISGVDLARQIDRDVSLIFITAHDAAGLQALHALQL